MRMSGNWALAAGLVAAVGATAAWAEPDGAALFQQNCSACHQAQGQGVKGAFPALAGDAFVQGDEHQVAALLLHGRGGMPNFSEDLSDDQIAAILSFVRSAWGNHAPPLKVATVAQVRAGSHTASQDGTSVLPGH